MKLQSQSHSLGASHHLQARCALLASHLAPGFELLLAHYNRTSPARAPIRSITHSPSLSHHRNPIEFAYKRFLTSGFLQTAVSDTPRPTPEIHLLLTTGRVRYSTSVYGAG